MHETGLTAEVIGDGELRRYTPARWRYAGHRIALRAQRFFSSTVLQDVLPLP